jgi:hypothetical protein
MSGETQRTSKLDVKHIKKVGTPYNADLLMNTV